MECWDLSAYEYNDGDEDRTDKYIEKQTHRERTNTDELSSEVEPSDEYTDDFLCCRVSVIVEEVVTEVVDWPLHRDRCRLSHDDDGEGEHESRREIGIHRAEILSKPVVGRDEYEPVEYESEYIPSEYDHDDASEEPHISSRHLCTPEERCRIAKYPIHHIETECTNSWEDSSSDSRIEYSDEDKKYCHKNPSREYRIGDRETGYHESRDNLPLWLRDMRCCMFRSGMSRSLSWENDC